MSDNCQGTVRCRPEDLQEALAIHTRKITDSCRDKDCIEDLRVYLTKGSQALLDAATGAKVRCAELLHAYIDVEPVAFDRNHYCIDVTFYYRILADATVGAARPAALYGLKGKGMIREGYDADLCLLDPDTIIDAANYKDWNARCPGLKHVFVAGEAVVTDSVHDGRLLGKALLRSW